MGQGVTRIERDRALEVGDRTGDERRVERLEPNAAVGERLIGFEADSFRGACAAARRPLVVPSVSANCATIRSWTSNTCSSAPSALASASATPDAASTTRAVMRSRSPARWKLPTTARSSWSSARSADRSVPTRRTRFDDPHAIDDPVRAGRAQVVGHGLGNAGREPGKLAVRADVGEIQHADERDVLARRLRLDDGSAAGSRVTRCTGEMKRYPRRATVWI